MDKAVFLGFDVWEFAALSLRRPYGRLFLKSVLLRHPLRSAAGLLAYIKRVRPATQNGVAAADVTPGSAFEGELAHSDWIVGMGFCQKPLDPPCPSGRFNHRCWMLAQSGETELPPACRTCHIREVATRALPAGASIHIMTSAVDAANDLLLPNLRHQRSSLAVLSVCPYSVGPMRLAMTICGIIGIVLAYGPGVCQDFAAWVQADDGVKPEQTSLPLDAHSRLLSLLDKVAAERAAGGQPTACRFAESGNFYVPVA